MILKEESGDILRIIDKIEKIGSEKVKEQLSKLIDKEKVDQIMNFITINRNK